MGEGATTPAYASTYERTGVYLKVIRRKGAVTNFLQDASKNYIDAAAVEMENHIQSHVYDLVVNILYGNAAANVYGFSGIDRSVTTNRYNGAQGGTVPTDLSLLDTMIDENTSRQGFNHRKCFVMSPQMLSKFSRLLTNVRLNQGLEGAGLSTVDVPGGWRLAAYRDVPIIQSTQFRPTVTMGTVTPSTATTGGTIADQAGGIKMRVAPVTWGGEQLASAEISQVTSGGGTSTLTLTFAAVAGALYYKIYGSVTTGACLLVKVIPARLYDSSGTPGAAVTSVRFTTNPYAAEPTVDQLNGASLVGTTLASTVATSQLADIPMIATGGVAMEQVFFWDLDEYQGLGKLAYTNSAGSRFNGLVTTEPLAKTDDNLPFMVKTYAALVPAWEATSYVARGLRTA